MSRRPTGRSRRHGARRVAAPTYPLPTGGLVAWYEAGLTGLDAADEIETFDDVSGNGNDLTCIAAEGSRIAVESSASYGDTLIAKYAGGGANNDQVHSRATWTQGLQAQPICRVFVGAIPDNVAGSARTILDGGSATHRQILYRLNNSSGGHTITSLTPNLLSNDYRTTPCIMWLIHDGTSSAIYIDDPATPVATGSTGTAGLQGLTIATGMGLRTGTALDLWGVGVYKATDVGDFSEAWKRAVGAYVWQKTSGNVGVEP